MPPLQEEKELVSDADSYGLQVQFPSKCGERLWDFQRQEAGAKISVKVNTSGSAIKNLSIPFQRLQETESCMVPTPKSPACRTLTANIWGDSNPLHYGPVSNFKV